jgi:membrane-associated phospholipid phosphatase
MASFLPVGAGGAAAVLLARRGFVRVSAYFTAIFQIVTVLAAEMIWVYPAAVINRPLADGLIMHADHLLGFNWRWYADVFTGHDTLLTVMGIAYGSLGNQFALLLTALAVKGDLRRMSVFVVSQFIALMAAVAGFALLPTTAAWYFQGLSLQDIPAYWPIQLMGDHWIDVLNGLRSGTLRVLDPASEFALISIPSYHTIAAILNIWGFWRIKYLRYPMLAVNLLMISATPLFGAHYLTDVLAAFPVALASLWFATRIADRKRRASGSQCLGRLTSATIC